MMRKILIALTYVIIMALNSGCVRRIVTINSQPEQVKVYFDRKFVGETPCDFEFFYYGTHHLELTKEGYENLNTTLRLKGPIYEYFPLSFFSEIIIPWEIINKHSYAFKLEKGESRRPVISPIQQPQAPLPAPDLKHIQR